MKINPIGFRPQTISSLSSGITRSKLLLQKADTVSFSGAFSNAINKLPEEEILKEMGIKVLEKDEKGLFTIDHYKMPEKYSSAAIINENRLFKKIKCIKNKADFSYSKVKDLGNLEKIGGNADFRDSQVTNLGELKEIGGSADFRYSKITDLGNLKKIGEWADFSDSEVTNLGNLEEIGGGTAFRCSKVTNLGNLKKIGGNADFCYSKVNDFGALEEIGVDAVFWEFKIPNLGNLKKIGGNAFLSWTSKIDCESKKRVKEITLGDVVDN